ncbi:MAG TPA: hypothetical protein VGI87_12155 [Solirubrobacteraceae bacterium]|jgi:hypothetical protein
MGPLGFVNWHRVNVRFRFLMWMVALVLAIIVLAHVVPSGGMSRSDAAAATGGSQAFHHAAPRTASP